MDFEKLKFHLPKYKFPNYDTYALNILKLLLR